MKHVTTVEDTPDRLNEAWNRTQMCYVKCTCGFRHPSDSTRFMVSRAAAHEIKQRHAQDHIGEE